MHTHAQSKGRLTTNDRQPPLAVGASLCSLPCGLFMQYETSLYAVTQLIRDARRLLSCVRMVKKKKYFELYSTKLYKGICFLCCWMYVYLLNVIIKFLFIITSHPNRISNHMDYVGCFAYFIHFYALHSS